MKLNPEMANLLGGLGEGALSVCPWLLDDKTVDLLSRAGYDPNQDGKIYTGFRLGFTSIALVLLLSLTVGMVSPLLSILEVLVCTLCTWFLPNLILSGQTKR